jgi:hypothetical protein
MCIRTFPTASLIALSLLQLMAQDSLSQKLVSAQPSLNLEDDRAAAREPHEVVLGSVEPDYRFPWVVKVDGTLGCHGTLIGRHWVLTSAHCVETTLFSTTIRYWRTSLSGVRTSGAAFDGTQAFVHPEYELGSSLHDIALVHLRTPLDASHPAGADPLLQPLALPVSPVSRDQNGVLASTTHHTGGPLPVGTVAVLRGKVTGTSALSFDIQSPSASLCPGDSGSGFVTTVLRKAYVSGIASSIPISGLDCDNANVPAHLTAVYGHLDWIGEVTRMVGQIQGTGDFNGDGKTDILWRNSNGRPAIWFMNGGVIQSQAYLPVIPGSEWQVQGMADFNIDGKADILWRHTNGTVAIWFMKGTVIEAQGYPAVIPGNEWQISGTGDFNIDGRADILWRHTSGAVSIWFMKGAVIENHAYLSVIPGNDWTIQGTGDFNIDGRADILWRNTNGAVSIWFMKGAVIENQAYLSVVPGNDWKIQGTGDFNIDGRTDILWRNTNGAVSIWFMKGAVIENQSYLSVVPGNDWEIQDTGDFNRDNRSDILWRNNDGTVAIWLMKGGVIQSQEFPFVP